MPAMTVEKFLLKIEALYYEALIRNIQILQ